MWVVRPDDVGGPARQCGWSGRMMWVVQPDNVGGPARQCEWSGWMMWVVQPGDVGPARQGWGWTMTLTLVQLGFVITLPLAFPCHYSCPLPFSSKL